MQYITHLSPRLTMQAIPLIPKLIHKPLMELCDLPHPLRPRRQKRRPEMLRAFFLPKARAGDNTDSCGVQETEAVEFVGLATFFLGLGGGFVGDGDGGEEVH